MTRRGTLSKKTYPVWERRTRVAELYLQGKSQPQIAKLLDVAQPTIGRDLKAIREEWLKSSLRDFDIAKAQELAKIDKLEEQSWEAWFRSTLESRIDSKKTESIRRTVQGGKRGAHKLIPTKVVENITVKNCPGDPKFLEQIAWCIETRLKVIGAFKDTTSINQLVIDWSGMLMKPSDNPMLDVDVIESRIAAAELPYNNTIGEDDSDPNAYGSPSISSIDSNVGVNKINYTTINSVPTTASNPPLKCMPSTGITTGLIPDTRIMSMEEEDLEIELSKVIEPKLNESTLGTTVQPESINVSNIDASNILLEDPDDVLDELTNSMSETSPILATEDNTLSVNDILSLLQSIKQSNK